MDLCIVSLVASLLSRIGFQVLNLINWSSSFKMASITNLECGPLACSSHVSWWRARTTGRVMRADFRVGGVSSIFSVALFCRSN